MTVETATSTVNATVADGNKRWFTWTSASFGRTRTKVGFYIATVPAATPLSVIVDKLKASGHANGKTFMTRRMDQHRTRMEESYLVESPDGNIYWPYTNALTEVTAQVAEQKWNAIVDEDEVVLGIRNAIRKALKQDGGISRIELAADDLINKQGLSPTLAFPKLLEMFGKP